MTETKYNLSQDVAEYFQFELRGHLFRFRYINSIEAEALQKADTKEKMTEEMMKFITKVNPESPDFVELSQQMIPPELRNFKNMLETELGFKAV